MQRLSPAAKFEHLPQHRDPPPGRRVPQHVQHGPDRIRIGVVAIVKNQNSAVIATFTAHFSRLKIFHGFDELLWRDSINLHHCESRENVRNAVAAAQGRLEVSRTNAELQPVGVLFNVLRANLCIGRQAVETCPSPIHRLHARIVRIEHRRALRRQ
jgi:hypothetical protein